VEAVHDRLICEDETAVALRLVGTDGGVVFGDTVTVRFAVAEPALLVAVSVYVVVTAGETLTEDPLTFPTP
jgi:hypothetical protein